MKAVILLSVFLFFTLVAGDVLTKVSRCPGVDKNTCNITEVRVDPCRPKPNKMCRLKRGRDVSLSFDFVPNFSADEMVTAAYSNDMIFNTLGKANACELSTCPYVQGTPNTFNYSLHIGKMLPKGQFPLQWKLWDKVNENKTLCCFQITIALD